MVQTNAFVFEHVLIRDSTRMNTRNCSIRQGLKRVRNATTNDKIQLQR